MITRSKSSLKTWAVISFAIFMIVVVAFNLGGCAPPPEYIAQIRTEQAEPQSASQPIKSGFETQIVKIRLNDIYEYMIVVDDLETGARVYIYNNSMVILKASDQRP